jgi:phosphoserine phosphatase RsbU/P
LPSVIVSVEPMNLNDQVLGILRSQVAGIILGSIFLFVGLGALSVALLRRRAQNKLAIWFGLFSALYGLRMLAIAPAAFALLPREVWSSRLYVVACITYIILVPALLFWLEISQGKLRWFVKVMLFAAFLLAIGGTSADLITKQPFTAAGENSLLAIIIMVVLGVVNAVPSLARKYMTEPSRVLAAGSIFLAAIALLNNLGTFFARFPNLNRLEPIGFAAFVLSLGYVTAQRVFSNERRLVTIESELSVAREIQQSILPRSVPQLAQLRVAASYLPMTSVAGDFYEFLAVDEAHAGFLVADVSGHGVPAALIASMIKVAIHSVSAHAAAPDDLLSGLNAILSPQLRGQFVTAAYLYIDLTSRKARYSAAGHPALLYWNSRTSAIEKIESNGLLFGVLPDTAYPVRDLEIHSGDRFLLYTDGLIEAENANGGSFGDGRLADLMSSHRSLAAPELSAFVLDEFSRWRPASVTQQDDVTLIVIDVT